MELKSYDKPWLPAFKGAFLIIFGIVGIINILGTIKSLAVLFGLLILLIGILLIATGIRYKEAPFRGWTIASGIIHLAFFGFLASRIDTAKDLYEAREGVIMVMLIWIVFYSVTEIVEAAILVKLKNAFASLFVMNAMLTLLFGYFLNLVSQDFNATSVFNLGVVALVFGIVNELSAYLLNKVK